VLDGIDFGVFELYYKISEFAVYPAYHFLAVIEDNAIFLFEANYFLFVVSDELLE
jgi:hypothetical protein